MYGSITQSNVYRPIRIRWRKGWVPEGEELELSEETHHNSGSALDLLVGDQVWNNLGKIFLVGLEVVRRGYCWT
jgi:hypothetical protein